MLKIIATFILIYLVFRILISFIFPKIGQYYLNRHRDRFYRNNPGAAKAKERSERQGINISKNGKKKKSDTDKIGEYVDFEEIDED